MIFKYIKKLEHLDFTFPENSPLNTSELLVANENFILPAIKYVRFKLNSFVTSDIIQDLTSSIKNVSVLDLEPATWAYFEYGIVLDILTQHLPNLKELHIRGLEFQNIPQSFFDILQSNLKKFNRQPNLFQITYEYKNGK